MTNEVRNSSLPCGTGWYPARRFVQGQTKAVLLNVLFCALSWSQAVSTSQIQGTVKDPSGSAVPGAEVEATQTGTGASRTVVSGPDGVYIVSNLPIGPYRLNVKKEGFAA